MIQLQLDALIHEAKQLNNPHLNQQLAAAREALKKSDGILETHQLYLQLPDDYKPPKGLGSCSGSKS